MNGAEAKSKTLASASANDRPVWEKPQITEVAIEAVTRSPYALGGNDGTPSITSVS